MDIQTKNIKMLVIDGDKYSIDLNDFKTMTAIDEFTTKRLNGEINPGTMMSESRKLIDTSIGKGTAKKIFPKDSIAVYYVALEICRIFQNEFIEMQEKLMPNAFDKEKQDVIEFTNVLQKFNQEMAYAKGKYDVDGKA